MPRRPRIFAPLAAAALATGALGGCHAVGGRPSDAIRERAPAPLDSMGVASDARVDSLGVLAGSFVGEGTSRSVHLISSDTALAAALARRYRPDLAAGDGLWSRLAEERVVRLRGERAPEVRRALVGSPLGHTEVAVDGVLLHGGRPERRCLGRGARVELVVREDRRRGDPPLRGPVLGALLADPAGEPRGRGLVERPEVPAPAAALTDRLIARTRGVMDSVIAQRFPTLQARPLHSGRLEINTLADLDAADVIAFRAGPGQIRYAVSLRERRVRAGGRDTLAATAVMAWDSAGAWRQLVFRPTVLAVVGGRLDAYGPVGDRFYWRRLQPIGDVAFARDNLWMEQVDVRNGSVLWGIVQPRGNVVVAAAEVEGVCSPT